MTSLLTPEDLKKICDDEDLARAKKAMESQRKDEEERAGLLEVFMARGIHPDAKGRVNSAVRRAAQQGNRKLLAVTFPAAYCNDKGRRINNLDPDWPDSLEGFAKKAYEFYMAELKPLNFKLNAQVLDYADGTPGNIGFYLSWS
jgi:hypothetical protein